MDKSNEYIDIQTLENFIEKMKKAENNKIHYTMLMTTLFPSLYKNLEEKLKDAYTQGYLTGLHNLDRPQLP